MPNRDKLEGRVIAAAVSDKVYRQRLKKAVNEHLCLFKVMTAARIVKRLVADDYISPFVSLFEDETDTSWYLKHAQVDALSERESEVWLGKMIAESSMTDDSTKLGDGNVVTFGQALAKAKAFNEQLALHQPMPLALPIDRFMQLRRSQLWTLAARPGVGKTWIALQTAVYAAKHGVKVMIATLEMEIAYIMTRILSLVNDPASEWLNHISFYEESCVTTQIKPFCELMRQSDPDLLIIDHVRKMRDEEMKDDFTSLNSVVNHLVQLKKNGGPAIWLIAHINREGAGKPGLHHLKGTGELEDSSDAVLILTKNQLTIAKARYGVEGYVKVMQNPNGRFVAMT